MTPEELHLVFGNNLSIELAGLFPVSSFQALGFYTSLCAQMVFIPGISSRYHVINDAG